MLGANFKIKDIFALGKAYKDAVGGDVVDDAEIMRRAKICGQCSLRKKFRTISPTQVSKALGMHANKNRVPDSLTKYKCNACACSLMMMIPSKTLHRDNPAQAEYRKKRAPACWVPGAIEAQS